MTKRSAFNDGFNGSSGGSLSIYLEEDLCLFATRRGISKYDYLWTVFSS